MAERKRLEFDHYTTPQGRVIDAAHPWFKIEGSRSVFKFLRYVEKGARKWIDCWSDNEGWRSFYVGLRPYERLGITVRPVKIKVAKPRAPKKKKKKVKKG